jgi:hypothetical protein
MSTTTLRIPTLRIPTPVAAKPWVPKHLMVLTPVATAWRRKSHATPAKPTTNTRNCPMLTAKALKVALVLDPAAIQAFRVPNGDIRTTIAINVAGRTVTADLASKSIRKAAATIAEHGVNGVVCVLQGKLQADDTPAEAGLAAQIKTPPVAEKVAP